MHSLNVTWLLYTSVVFFCVCLQEDSTWQRVKQLWTRFTHIHYLWMWLSQKFDNFSRHIDNARVVIKVVTDLIDNLVTTKVVVICTLLSCRYDNLKVVIVTTIGCHLTTLDCHCDMVTTYDCHCDNLRLSWWQLMIVVVTTITVVVCTPYWQPQSCRSDDFMFTVYTVLESNRF